MKLLSIEINCFRGIKHLELNFNGNNAVIYGDNGTGKSGVIDAIDFLIKGDITRLSGSGSASLDLAKHGKYVTEDISDAWVKAKVKLPAYSKEIEIKRFLKNPTILVCDSEYSKDFEAIKNISAYNAHYLSRKEILQFINSTEQERAKSIEKLLNIITLEKNRTSLQKVKKSIEVELKTKKIQEKTYIDAISGKLGVDSNLWIDVINELREKLGAKEIPSLDSDLIVSGLSLSQTTATSSELTAFIDKLSNIYKLFNEGDDCLISKINKVKLNYEKILITKEYEEQLALITLYEQGQKLLTDNSCPLCGHEIVDKEKFRTDLQVKIDNLKSTKQANKDYSDSLHNVKGQLISLKQQFDFLNIDKAIKVCSRCGNIFIPKFGFGNTQQYCSDDCRYNSTKATRKVIKQDEKYHKIDCLRKLIYEQRYRAKRDNKPISDNKNKVFEQLLLDLKTMTKERYIISDTQFYQKYNDLYNKYKLSRYL